MNTNACLALLVGLSAMSALQSAEQTWNPVDGSPLWNLTAPNWDEGTLWGVEDGSLTNSAVFGESDCKDLVVEGNVPFGGARFLVDGYRIGGTGTLWLPTSSSSAYRACQVSVAAGCRATLAARASYEVDSFFVKQGPGTLDLANELHTLRLRVSEGAVRLLTNNLYTAKLEVVDRTGPSSLYLDAANIHVKGSNNGVFIGDAGRFDTAEIGPGGVKFTMDGDGTLVQNLSTAAGVEKDGGIRKDGAGVLKLFSTNTFNGGLSVKLNQVRFNDSCALGTGPISIEGGNLMLDSSGRRVDVTNRIGIAEDSYVGTVGKPGDELALHCVGFVDANARRRLLIGRKEGYSAARLVLDGPESAPVGRIEMRGGLDLTVDGGTLSAAGCVWTQYFHTATLDATNLPVVKVDAGGFRFDSNGYGTDLGVTLKLHEPWCETNYVASAGAFANPGFESGSTGWQQTTTTFSGGGRYNNTSDFVKNNSGVIVDDYTTTHGTYFWVIRQLARLTGSFTVPEDGDWAVAFEIGCRPRTDYAGHKVSVTVTIDAGTADEKVYVVGPRPRAHPFTRFQTDAWPLTQGPHTITVATDNGNAKQSFESLLLDDFQLLKAETTAYPNPPVVKLGEGLLMIADLQSGGLVAVSNGTLRLQDYALDGARAEVSAGGTLALDAGVLTNSTVQVDDGGTLSLRGARNLIPFADADLEGFDLESVNETKGKGYIQLSTVMGWMFERQDGQTATSGVQRNGGTLSSAADSKLTKSGCNTLFLRSNTRVSRTVDVPASGTYRVSFLQAARIYAESHVTPFSVSVDGQTVLEVAARESYEDFRREIATVALDAGEHTLVIEATGGTKSGRLLFLDDIRFERVDAAQMEVADTRIDLASGATLDLQNAAPIYLPGGVFVDGVKFTGGRARLERKGVVVTGEGQIQVGPPDSSVLLIR